MPKSQEIQVSKANKFPNKKHWKKILPALKAIASLSDANRIALLSELAGDDPIIRSICACVHSVVLTNLDEKDLFKKKLANHKKDLRSLSNPSISSNHRRKLMKQNGGSPIGLILSVAIPLLTELIAKSTK